MTICENCGNNIPEDVIHTPGENPDLCHVRSKENGTPRGFARKRPPKDLYRKKA